MSLPNHQALLDKWQLDPHYGGVLCHAGQGHKSGYGGGCGFGGQRGVILGLKLLSCSF